LGSIYHQTDNSNKLNPVCPVKHSMYDRISNVESDADLKTRAMNYILREICAKYKNKKDPTFTSEEVRKRLQGLGSQYLDLNVRDLLRGSQLIEIDDNYNLTLNEKGKQYCEDQ
jgi:hypothetical protein